MDVILLERIEKLGLMGEVVKVKTGFARNYLLPQKKAVRATDENRRKFEAQRAQLEASNLERKAEAEKVAARMGHLTVVLIRQAGEASQLYGSVNARDIALAVTEAGFTIGRPQVGLNEPIKSLGLHPVSVSLHPEVTVRVTANVARSEEEAALQAQSGRVVSRIGDEEGPEEVAIEEQAMAVFEQDAAQNAIEELSAESPSEAGTQGPTKKA
ncbi:MAG: 50S ribosomal protein L9 [Rhodospirillales bacterium]